jgi:predicted transposase YbfD/YdcC
LDAMEYEDRPVRDSLRLLLNHLGEVPDVREPAKVRFPLREVLFLVTCGSMAGCDDYDEIVAWGQTHLDFLRQHEEFYFGVPKEDWLCTLMNRIDPALFEACFYAWACSLRPDAPDMIALDGKTLRRSGDAGRGAKPCHLVSAWASTQRLVLAQEAVDAKTNECAAMLDLLARMDLKGTLVTIDAIATNPTVAQAILDAGGDYVLALKKNQAALHAEVATYFDDADEDELETVEMTEKDHGRLEQRRYSVSYNVDWVSGARRHPDEPRLPELACLIKTTTRSETKGKVTQETRYFVSSRKLSAEQAGTAIRSHWGIESLHWILDVTFKEDLSRLRRGNGAQNMALVRRLALNLVRAGKGRKSIKTARKTAGWNPNFLETMLRSKSR